MNDEISVPSSKVEFSIPTNLIILNGGTALSREFSQQPKQNNPLDQTKQFHISNSLRKHSTIPVSIYIFLYAAAGRLRRDPLRIEK